MRNGPYVQQRRAEQAVRVLGAVDAYRMDRGLPLSSREHRRVESIITLARTLTGPVRFGLAWAAGHALTLTQIVDEALQAKPCPQHRCGNARVHCFDRYPAYRPCGAMVLTPSGTDLAFSEIHVMRQIVTAGCGRKRDFKLAQARKTAARIVGRGEINLTSEARRLTESPLSAPAALHGGPILRMPHSARLKLALTSR